MTTVAKIGRLNPKNIRVGDKVAVYDSSQSRWFRHAVIRSIDPEKQTVTVGHDNQKPNPVGPHVQFCLVIDYHNLPHTIMTDLQLWEIVFPKVRDNVIAIAKHKAEYGKMPSGMFIETHDMVFQMCTQRSPFNYSSALYRSGAEFPALVYGQLAPKATSDALTDLDKCRAWRELLTHTPTPTVLALTVNQCFNYLNRFYVKHTYGPNDEELLDVKDSVIKASAQLPWDTIVGQVMAPCLASASEDPTLVLEIVRLTSRFLPFVPSQPGLADLEHAPQWRQQIARAYDTLKQVKMKIYYDAVNKGVCVYGAKNRILIPEEVAGMLTEFMGV